jgi:hypothetical protein
MGASSDDGGQREKGEVEAQFFHGLLLLLFPWDMMHFRLQRPLS